ncbi:MAG: hypothetical protein IPK50_10525 [Fibrobacterota bacterium]|nr:hypothetical protein [Fibrobacterota bacterium]QQS07311.1 MAG: hypothetical protein IPK50_10525 [Fibrobacterota bacterium]
METSPTPASWIDRLPSPQGRPLPTWLVLFQSQITLVAVLLFLRTIDLEFLRLEWKYDSLGMFLRLFVPALAAAGGWLLFFGRRESAIAFLLHATYLVYAGRWGFAHDGAGALGLGIDVACAVYALRILPRGGNDGIRPVEAILPWVLRRPTFLWSVASVCLAEVLWSVPRDESDGSILTRAMEGLSVGESALVLASEIGVLASAVFLIALRREALYVFGFVLVCMFFLYLGDTSWFSKVQLAKGALICVYLAVLTQRGVLGNGQQNPSDPPGHGPCEQEPCPEERSEA